MPKLRQSAEVKARVVIRTLQDHVEVSTICAELKIHPAVFYQWRKQFLDSASLVFARTDKAQERQTKQLIAELELRIQKIDNVIAELMEEYTNLKKRMGCVKQCLG